ncbi:MAG TPA: hypothetical protein VN653_13390, partial [Anaerolineales bacterium]|nr:hypothetical protein [Anaerolineales bacterium]
MLEHLEQYTLEHHIHLLRLETGIHQKEAIGLYQRMGYQNIPPFGDYLDDPLSRFFDKKLN